MNQKKSTLFSLKKNRTQCSPGLLDGSVLQIIKTGISVISFNVSEENIPSKYLLVIGFKHKAFQ